MSRQDEILAPLQSDANLLEILTGGVYAYQDSGRTGLNRVQQMQAFLEDTGHLKPTCIIYVGDEKEDGQIVDMPTGTMSTQVPFSGFIYDDGDVGYANIEAAEHIIYQLLHGYRVPNGFQILWKHTYRDKREALLGNACYWQFDATLYGLRSYAQ